MNIVLQLRTKSRSCVISFSRPVAWTNSWTLSGPWVANGWNIEGPHPRLCRGHNLNDQHWNCFLLLWQDCLWTLLSTSACQQSFQIMTTQRLRQLSWIFTWMIANILRDCRLEVMFPSPTWSEGQNLSRKYPFKASINQAIFLHVPLKASLMAA